MLRSPGGTSSHGVEQIVQRPILRLHVEKGSANNPRVQLAMLLLRPRAHRQVTSPLDRLSPRSCSAS